jgi:hypothetical protein
VPDEPPTLDYDTPQQPEVAGGRSRAWSAVALAWVFAWVALYGTTAKAIPPLPLLLLLALPLEVVQALTGLILFVAAVESVKAANRRAPGAGLSLLMTVAAILLVVFASLWIDG